MTFDFEVINTGNVGLGDLAVIDSMIADAGDTISCPVDALNVGGRSTCRATYTVTAADLGRPLTNTATVRAGTVLGTSISSGPDTAVLPTAERPTPVPQPRSLPSTGGPTVLGLLAGALALLLGGLVAAIDGGRRRRRRP